VAREWTKPPPDAQFSLRIPVEYASLHAAVRLLWFTLMAFMLILNYSDWFLDLISMYARPYRSNVT